MAVTQFNFKRVLPILLIIAAVLALVAAFATNALHQASAHSAPPADAGYVRVVHAAPGAGNVDVFVNNGKLLNNFAFGTVTDYVKVNPGTYRIRVAPAGKGVEDAVIDVKVKVESDVHYTAAALGTAKLGFSLKVFGDNNYRPDGKARVRVYHLSPNAGPVDVSVGKTKVIDELSYTHASNYLTVAPGSYTFKVTAVVPNVTINLPATLKEGKVYSVFALGLYKGTPALKFVVAVY